MKVTKEDMEVQEETLIQQLYVWFQTHLRGSTLFGTCAMLFTIRQLLPAPLQISPCTSTLTEKTILYPFKK